MDPFARDLITRDPIARNITDIMFVAFYWIKVSFWSSASFLFKLTGFLVFLSVLYLGRLITYSMRMAETLFVWVITVSIIFRLIAVWLIFTLIDYEDFAKS